MGQSASTNSQQELLAALATAGVVINGEWQAEFGSILSLPALRFVATLVREFGPRRDALLTARQERQARLDAGEMPDFLPQTAAIRAEDWRVAPLPADLQDRRVEITGPVDRKMVINALNSGAKVYMADFEDSHAPVWSATIQGQINLRDAIDGTISYVSPEGKTYRLQEKPAVLMARPRGWHLLEKHVLVDGQPISGSLFDFGLYCFHNAHKLLAKGSGAYFYLPKMESHLEARLWNDVFNRAEQLLALPNGSVRATVLIETILAAFEMDEILYELREHIVGLNCGRWDYIFSVIKKFREHPQFVLPDRAQVSMTTHFLRSYSLLLIQTCHRRGASAMGGMAAQIPIKNDPVANQQAIDKVIADKHREVTDGHDGTWVAHPGLVPIAMAEFEAHLPRANQIDQLREDVTIQAADLLAIPTGTATLAGLRTNINVGLLYLEAWLRGSGCVPLYNLMEDAATAEISRAQIWQWLRHQVQLADGPVVTKELVTQMLQEELVQLRANLGAEQFAQGKYELAATVFGKVATETEFVDFLTLPAYEYL